MDLMTLENSLVAGLVGAVVFAVASYYYCYFANIFSYWTKKGVLGPRPYFIGGNMGQILLGNRFETEKRWFKEYGKIHGIYENVKPVLVVADAEVMQQICIKDFDKFVNHDRFEYSNKYQKTFLISLRDEHWKKIRAVMSPTFTSGKIKHMFRLMDTCADDLVALFGEQLTGDGPQVVNIKDLYGMYTMDAITTCCYGLKLERDGSTSLKMAASRNDFVKIALKMFEINFKRMFIMFSLNKRLLKWLKFELTPENEVQPLTNRIEQLIKSRKASNKKFNDYLQLLIEAKPSDKLELNDMDTKENHHACLSHESLIRDQERLVSTNFDQQSSDSSKSMSTMEILSNATFLMVVGLETTASLLTFCTYALAFHQDIQERLYQEIKAIAECDDPKSLPKFNYDALTSCRYLDSVLSETLRRFPPAIITDRVAKEDYLIEKANILLPKGSKIFLHLFYLMNDPDNWVEPDRFDPERFMPGNRDMIVPGSYCPFGLGPRHCIGMRFSLTEAKLALAKTIMSYSFEPAPGTEYPPQPKMNLGLNGIKKPLVNLKLRAN